MKEVVLHKDLGYLQIDNTGVQVAIGPTRYGVAGSWKQTNFNLFVMEEQIDISGLTDMTFTFFPTGGDVQRGGPVSLGLTGGFITESIFVTSSPVKITTNFQAQTFRLPLQANSEFKNIIWGRNYTWALDTSLPQNFGRQIHTSLIGSGEPTNSDTLYVYRILTLQARTPSIGFAEIPTCRLILTGQMKEEAEFQQLMRFRRSYELAQGYDRD
jgi:hypothetical protein